MKAAVSSTDAETLTCSETYKEGLHSHSRTQAATLARALFTGSSSTVGDEVI